MGCGYAEISQHFKDDLRFTFLNYDHVAINDDVISCDISELPNDTVEICILSLAMWGSNCHKYIEEAHRVLESAGRLYIIEATKRWSEKNDDGTIITESKRLIELVEKNSFKITEKDNTTKFTYILCTKN